MSEYQYVIFRAIDQPVSEKNLKYMHRQSSRAEITPWSFENEYHYGDFRGDALEMMRRGYDVHLHFANFGIRKLLIRFPHGLPNKEITNKYFSDDGLLFHKDKSGPGGTLCIAPCHDADHFDYLMDIQKLFNRLIPLRAEILEGDLRPLYLANLVMATDENHDPEEEKEGPVPFGLKKISPAQVALTDFYELSDGILAAAAEKIPAHIKRDDSQHQYAAWLNRQSQSKKDDWLVQLMMDPGSSVRSAALAEFRRNCQISVWPTVDRRRTVAELFDAAAKIENAAEERDKQKAVRQKEKRLAELAADPVAALSKTEELVKKRSQEAYREIAKILSELSEALAGTDQADLPRQQAEKLREENTSCRGLVSELRKADLVGKKKK